MTTKELKKRKLRNNEYYDMQYTFDTLYKQSKDGKRFKEVIKIISSEDNIKLAYRNIKKNKGSLTRGINKHNIMHLAEKDDKQFIEYVQRRLSNFLPHTVKRVLIPKTNGDKRPLGIPTIEDRIIQQCVKQVLEPILEAKFHNNSYGFRPNRTAHHAIAKAKHIMNVNGLHYVVDIDIKGFFDNIDHNKLIKQLWANGIRDKQLICIIKKMLKANIHKIGIPSKGVPQGGILSPLLSNLALNELDWWISSQWETFKCNYEYSAQNKKIRALKTTRLKEMYIVRYADDFKIFCRTHNQAKRIFQATKQWLRERLNLEVNEEKSSITNLKKKYTEFLGFKLRVIKKPKSRRGYVAISDICGKAVAKIKKSLRDNIKSIQLSKENKHKEVQRYNEKVIGYHNYYQVATRVNPTLGKIAFVLSRIQHNRLKSFIEKNGKPNRTYKKLYGNYNFKIVNIAGITLFPLAGVKFGIPKLINPNINNYTVEGRKLVHAQLKRFNSHDISILFKSNIQNNTVEFNDNRISLFIAQQGKCAITKTVLSSGDIHCHHKLPKKLGGTDKYENLLIVTKTVHKLIHATLESTISKLLNELNLTNIQLKRVNTLRKLSGNTVISL